MAIGNFYRGTPGIKQFARRGSYRGRSKSRARRMKR